MPRPQRSSPSGPESGRKYSVTKAGGTAGTATVTNVTVTCAGARTTDLAVVNSTAALAAGLVLGSPRVSAADTVEVPLVNPTAAEIAAGTLQLSVELRRYRS